MCDVNKMCALLRHANSRPFLIDINEPYVNVHGLEKKQFSVGIVSWGGLKRANDIVMDSALNTVTWVTRGRLQPLRPEILSQTTASIYSFLLRVVPSLSVWLQAEARKFVSCIDCDLAGLKHNGCGGLHGARGAWEYVYRTQLTVIEEAHIDLRR